MDGWMDGWINLTPFFGSIEVGLYDIYNKKY